MHMDFDIINHRIFMCISDIQTRIFSEMVKTEGINGMVGFVLPRHGKEHYTKFLFNDGRIT